MINTGVVGEWNFGPMIDVDTKVSRIADFAARAWGGSASWELDSDRNLHEAGYLLLDSTKAREGLKWKDKLDFESTINWTFEFYKAVENGVNPRLLLERQVEEFLGL
jgi:CDP-glucose 4,6-dehydratase